MQRANATTRRNNYHMIEHTHIYRRPYNIHVCFGRMPRPVFWPETPHIRWAQHYAGSMCTRCPGAEGPADA